MSDGPERPRRLGGPQQRDSGYYSGPRGSRDAGSTPAEKAPAAPTPAKAEAAKTPAKAPAAATPRKRAAKPKTS